MQHIQRFVADQRFDLPQYESMLKYISAEFYAYNKRYHSPENRILKNWKIENNGGLQVRVNNSADSFLFNSERTGTEAINHRKAGDDLLTITLADNSTNYVELKIEGGLCAEDTVAIWDQIANGGVGEEFTQTVATAIEQRPSLVSNVIAFTNDPDKLPLAIVTTSGGVITNIQDARKILFEGEAYDFGVTRTDRNIDSHKAAYDAITTAIKEMKGTSNWFDVPYAGVKLLKEYQNMFITGGGDISWEGSNGANNLRWTANFEIVIADRPSVYVIDAVTAIAVPEGSCVYVDIPEGAPSGSIAPVVCPIADCPIDPASVGYSPRIQVLFQRRGGKIYGLMDIPELASGETAQVGEDLPKDIRTRLGITSETTYEAYTSFNIIFAADSYATALSKLDAAFYAFASDEAKEERFAVVAPQTVFTATTLTWHTSNTKLDIVVYVNGVKLNQATDGTSATGHYKKNSASVIEFFNAIPANATVTIRDERTGATIDGGGGVDLQNITVSPSPVSNGAHDLGTSTKAWGALYLKDTATAQIYKLSITNGVFQVESV